MQGSRGFWEIHQPQSLISTVNVDFFDETTFFEFSNALTYVRLVPRYLTYIARCCSWHGTSPLNN